MKKIKYLREILIVSVLVTIFIFLVVANNYARSYYHIGKGYEWTSSASTTNGLPVMIAKSDLHYAGYYENYCDQNVMLYGDESDNSATSLSCGGPGIGGYSELYPNTFQILYYSFNEDKFYGGNFKLDYTKVLAVAEQMRNAVVAQEGSGRTQSIAFKTKVYPMGKVVVSMQSKVSTSVSEIIIGTFQAQPENHDWSVFSSSNSDYNTRVSHNPSVAIQRALLLNKYNWNI